MAHFPKVRKWQRGGGRELIADPRDFLTARVDELMLGMIIGRSRPMMYGERTLRVKAQICEEIKVKLPWELDDDE